MHFYTLLAYKSDSSDYCCGCRTASYASEFECWTGTEADAIARRWADLLERNERLEHGEDSFAIELLINGMPQSFGSYLTNPTGELSEACYAQQEALASTFAALEARAKTIRAENKARQEAVAAEAARQADLAKAEAKRKAELATEQREREEFARLAAKFGGGAA